MKETKQEYLVIDFGRLGRMLLRRSWILALTAVLCAALTMGVGLLLAGPRYESSVLFCAGNEPQGEGLSASDLDASGKLVDGFSVILYSRQTLADVIAAAGAVCSVEELEVRITMEQIGQTQFFRVTVTGADGAETVKIAEAVGDVLPRRVAEITPGATATVVDPPLRASAPAGQDLPVWGIAGAALGLLLAALVLIVMDCRDDTIRGPEDLDLPEEIPVLAALSGDPAGDSDAFRLIRMNFRQFSASKQQCGILGITGPENGEGIAAVAAGLAESLARSHKKVLLMNCDLRTGGTADGLGLADYLEGRTELRNLFRRCQVPGGETYHILPAGTPAGDPGELLWDNRMEGILRAMGRVFDVILLRLPPVGESADALATAAQTDDYLLVVEENRCSAAALKEALGRLAFSGCRIAGVIYRRETRKKR